MADRRPFRGVRGLLARTMPGVPRYGAIAAIFGDLYFAERGRGGFHAAAGRGRREHLHGPEREGQRIWWRWLERRKLPTCLLFRVVRQRIVGPQEWSRKTRDDRTT